MGVGRVRRLHIHNLQVGVEAHPSVMARQLSGETKLHTRKGRRCWKRQCNSGTSSIRQPLTGILKGAHPTLLGLCTLKCATTKIVRKGSSTASRTS